MTDTPARSGSKLPVWRTVRAAYAIVFQEFGTLVRAASTWLVITTPMIFYLHWLLWLYEPGVRTQSTSNLAIILDDTYGVWIVLFELLPSSSIAVAWHRRVLLGESVNSPIYCRLDRVVGIFALINLSIVLPELIPLLIVVTISHWSNDEVVLAMKNREQLILLVGDIGIYFTAVISAVFLIPRLSIILPAKALATADVTMRQTWHATRGQTLRLALGSLLTNVPNLLVSAVYASATWQVQTRFNFALTHALYYFMTTMLNVIFVGFIAFAYRHLVEQDSRRIAKVFLPA
jgi:cbb3-type cytochrome oxidase subunit 3